MKLSKVLPTLFLTVIICFITSCSNDTYEKEKLCSTLYSEYTVKANFLISDGDKNTDGKADISKSSVTTVSFTEPSSFNGISIKSDSTGDADTFSFEFSGIPANVPKSLSGDLSLIFSLFSDDIPSKIKSLDDDAFRESALKNKNGNPMYEVFFVENGINYSITYDKYTGYPHLIDAGNDKLSVSIELSEFTPITIQE